MEQINSCAARPDVTVFLRVKPSTALRRRRAASLDLELYEVAAFQRALLGAYGEAISRARRMGERLEIVDGERAPDEVAADVARIVRRLL